MRGVVGKETPKKEMDLGLFFLTSHVTDEHRITMDHKLRLAYNGPKIFLGAHYWI